MSLPFELKICGITEAADAQWLGEYGVRCIGLNFSQHSPRQVNPAQATELAAAYRSHAGNSGGVVGVFVEQTIQQANEIAELVGLDWIQLHGDHPLGDLDSADRPVIWVQRVRAESEGDMKTQLSETLQRIEQWKATAQSPEQLAAVLLDAHVQGQWGGTGATLVWGPLGERSNWQSQNDQWQNWPVGLPLILAGGIQPQNAGQARREARPDALDVASGVEEQPGKKSPDKVRALLGQMQDAT